MDQLQNEPWLSEGRCWICGALADSAEHLAKASDLRFNWGRGPFAITPKDAAPIKIQGPNSSKVKYRPSLCKTCNNTRTQPSDLAWEEFNLRIQSVAARRVNGGLAYLPKLFSSSRWRQVMLGVHLYWAKALGCYLAECNERHRADDLREALMQAKPCSTLQLIFFAVPNNGERLLHKTSLNVWQSMNAAFFMYSLNSICVVPALSPSSEPRYQRFQHWHPNSLAKTIRLHRLREGNWREAADRNTARHVDEGGEAVDWRDYGEE